MPSTLQNDPLRIQLPENEEQPIHPFYGYVYVTDLHEGLVVVGAAALFDGNPENNFLRRVKIRDGKGGDVGDSFNPDGRLTGATHGVCAGHRVFITTKRGLAVVDVNRPEQPRLVGELADGFLTNPRAISIQFRYAFVTDDDGLKVVDISNPERPRGIRGATVRLRDAHKLYVARTYAYVANGAEGLAIIDVENPEKPRLQQMFNAGGALNDTHAVQIGSVNASMYALVADGKNGLRVLQMISPDTVEGSQGFSPRPSPRLIASFPTPEPALAVSRGLDRDRVVDETGHQTVVFGRRGARPFRLEEMRPFLRHSDGTPYRVEDIAMRKVEEEIEVNGQKQKVWRTGVFTKSGKELLPEDTGVPVPPPRPPETPLLPTFDTNQALPPIQPPPPKPAEPAPTSPPSN
jgi:hypothetical protein